MSRPLRIEFPDAWYHVMNRARLGQEAFPAREDYLNNYSSVSNAISRVKAAEKTFGKTAPEIEKASQETTQEMILRLEKWYCILISALN